MSRKTYPLPKSGKTATRMDYKTGLTEIAVPGGRGVVRRYGPTLAWIVVARGSGDHADPHPLNRDGGA